MRFYEICTIFFPVDRHTFVALLLGVWAPACEQGRRQEQAGTTRWGETTQRQ